MLIDAQGCLIAAMNGPADWSGPDAQGWWTQRSGADSGALPRLRFGRRYCVYRPLSKTLFAGVAATPDGPENTFP